MSAQSEALAAMVEGMDEHRDCNIRSVGDGYILTGQRRWLDPETNNAVASITSETIAEDHTTAAERATVFLATGTFTS